jgi:spoIIIJ-associated protein
MEKYKFQSKNQEDLLEKALTELDVIETEVITKMSEEKGGLFGGKKYTLEVVKLSDIAELGKDLLKELLNDLNVKANVETKIRENQIKYQIHSENNSILIGKNGKTLQALNDVCRYAVASKFKRHYRILLDINEYKNEKYAKLSRIAKRVAKEVLHTKQTVHLDPMPADERRIVHNTLTKFKNISTQSEGNGNRRHIVISYKD